MKLIARILPLFILFTSVASAWGPDNYGSDIAHDSAGVVSSHDDGAPDGQAKDLCGHCGHLESHLLGQITDNNVVTPHAVAVRHGEPDVIDLLPSLHPLFRPPRNTLSV
ncbi:MAG: hypothetical protein ACYDBW_05075 [Sulfuricaulis sp.]